MLGFSPFKKRPNQFNYIPRYYDPAKEEREQRRAELLGQKAEQAGAEYRPGQYIRTQSEARSERRRREASQGSGRIAVLIGLVVLVLLFMLFGYPKLVAFFSTPRQSAQPAVEEFNPYTPITVVPNDYEEE